MNLTTRTPRKSRFESHIALLGLAVVCLSCGSESKEATDAIVVGAVLPFSGDQSATGLNIEQAISLAIKDVNAAGGVNGRPLRLISRDSNSGSPEGYEQAKRLLSDKNIKYLIGPEEASLAVQLVPDVKARNSLNILPSYTAPYIIETGDSGAWIRLAPRPQNFSCAMAIQAIMDGHETALTIVSRDDYQMLMATAFNTFFSELGGRSLGSLAVEPDAESYLDQLDIIQDMRPDLVVMMVYPPSGVVLTEEWLISEIERTFYLAPTLHTDMFLKNLPVGALEGFYAFSPSQSHERECTSINEVDNEKSDRDTDSDPTETETDVFDNEDAGGGDSELDGGEVTGDTEASYNRIDCEHKNFDRFSEHYTDMWKYDRPLPASLFYYDAVVVLALGLQRAAEKGDPDPPPTTLREHIRIISEGDGSTIEWSQLKAGFAALKRGEDINYYGAAAEYRFRTRAGVNYGETSHRIIDMWTVKDNRFVLAETINADCGYHEMNDAIWNEYK